MEERDPPQRDEDVRREQEKHDDGHLGVESARRSEEFHISANRQSLMQTDAIRISQRL